MIKYILLIAVIMIGSCNPIINKHRKDNTDSLSLGDIPIYINKKDKSPVIHDTIYLHDTVIVYRNAHINHADNVNIGGGYPKTKRDNVKVISNNQRGGITAEKVINNLDTGKLIIKLYKQ